MCVGHDRVKPCKNGRTDPDAVAVTKIRHVSFDCGAIIRPNDPCSVAMRAVATVTV